jgi:hypothetical protein
MCNIETHFCSKGIFINTTEPSGTPDTMKCCFGPGAGCENKSLITSVSACLDYDGKIYSPGPRYECTSGAVNIPGATSNIACCLGFLITLDVYANIDAVSNKSFLCFKEGEENLFTQCCYDRSCTNLDKKTGLISRFERRVLSKGASIHTIENYDMTINENVTIINRGRKSPFRAGSDAPITFTQFVDVGMPSLKGFGYLELDILTDARNVTLIVHGKNDIYGTNLGGITSYSTNGAEPRVWHHIVVPLARINRTEIAKIAFRTGDSIERYIIVDNILLTPSDTTINTEPYYCTGGFEGWVKDLDAPLGTTDFSVFGPHMFACSGLAAFRWTGTQCCGDDTKDENRTERFNDTSAGCFDGSMLKDNQAVWAAKGYFDSGNSANDKVKAYKYNYLLYNNNSFVGCQMPNGFSPLNVTYNGTVISTSLVTRNIEGQCTTFGDYYCMNGQWRQSIRTNNLENQKFLGQTIYLKTVPAGGELLKVGFRPEDGAFAPVLQDVLSCNDVLATSPSVCNGTGNCTPEGCDCDDGYEGLNCDSISASVVSCNGIPITNESVCSGNGTCKLLAGEPVCVCFSEYTGTNCELSRDSFVSCGGTPVCNDHGTCGIDGICDCDDGYEGITCTLELEPEEWYCNNLIMTNPDSCSGNGDCTRTGCDCDDGWIGPLCNKPDIRYFSTTTDLRMTE